MRTRPIYHSSDAAIRGHVFCSFPALVLQQEVIDGCRTAGLAVEWADLMRDLDRLQQADVELDGKHITARTPVAGQVGRVFQAIGVALPPNMRERAVQAGISGKCSANTDSGERNLLISKNFPKLTVQVGLEVIELHARVVPAKVAVIQARNADLKRRRDAADGQMRRTCSSGLSRRRIWLYSARASGARQENQAEAADVGDVASPGL